MIIVYGLFIYSIYEFLKFLFLATLGDIITTIKGNYDSPERDRAINQICGQLQRVLLLSSLPVYYFKF